MTPASTSFADPQPGLDVRPGEILAVIPSLNEERHIEACIRSLMAGSDALRHVPLVVADGGSSDQTVAIVTRLMSEYPGLSVIHNAKRLQSAALNLAAATRALPDTAILVRCDAHSIYPPNFIMDVARAVRRTGAASVVIPMDAVGETCFEKANAWIVDTPLGSGGSAHRGGVKSGYIDHGHHAGFDLAWYRRIDGYDETFSHNEDAEYDERLGKAGGKVWMEANIRIAYTPRGSVRGVARQYFNYGKGRARNSEKHGRRLKIRHTLPILALFGGIIGTMGGFFAPVLWILPAGYASILLLASLWISLKHRSACGLFAGMASGAMHLGWAAGFLKQKFLNRKIDQ